MTDIEVLLSNLGVTFARLCTSAIGIWAFYYFVKTIFGEGGRNPVKIGIALAVIAGAGAGYKMIPTLLQAGENTGSQMGGSSGGSYSMSPLGTLPSDSDHAAVDRAAFAPAAVTSTHSAHAVLVSIPAANTVQPVAA